MMRKGLGCAIGFAVLLLAMVVGGAVWLLDSVQRVTSDGQVEGVIVDLVESLDSDGDRVYAPVVEYVVGDTIYRIQSAVDYGGLAVPDIGDVRTVYYDVDNPTDATFRGFWTLWFFPGLLTGLPLLVLIAMVASAVRTRRRENRYGSPPPDMYQPQPAAAAVDEDVHTLRDGTEIVADFMGAEASPMDAAGVMRYRIRAQAEIDDVIRRFEGPWRDDDPTLDFMRSGNRVKIRIDPADPSRYEVLGPITE